jgi:cellulose synthase/poly-beta-1,6-N-acetylglucosamine synthase-like glycosyltransferase
MSPIVVQAVDYLNFSFLIYFAAANLVYTVLMALSLYGVSLHSKYAAARGYTSFATSPFLPPVALLVPAHNEEDAIVQTVRSALALNYPLKEVIVVDDGSRDDTVARLVEAFELERIDCIYRQSIEAPAPLAYYRSRSLPNLKVISVAHAGKAAALNTAIDIAQSPFVCTVDADCIIERDALLRLVAPVMRSPKPTAVSGGVVRVANGCAIREGHIVAIDLPRSWIERCQIVEYIRTFLFGRPGWAALNATFIASGAFCLLQKEAVVGAGGFNENTVTEDIDIIARIRRYLREEKREDRVVFTTDPICWTEAPRDFKMLARQRRRWQLGLIQTTLRYHDMVLNPKYGAAGVLSIPFHAYIEGFGSVFEALGTLLIPLFYFLGLLSVRHFVAFMFLAVGYGTLLSIGSVVLEEMTIARYPRMSHLRTLLIYAVLENIGYRQMVTFFRAQGVLKYFFGRHRWETVVHSGTPAASAVEGD